MYENFELVLSTGKTMKGCKWLKKDNKKNLVIVTGVGCHFLLQCMKVKSESEVAQSCLTLCDPMDCSLLGSSIHGIFQARVLEWGAIAFSGEGTLTKGKSLLLWEGQLPNQ